MKSELRWVEVKFNWRDWAWYPPINSGGLNYIAAYRVATDDDIKDAESDAIYEVPVLPTHDPSDFWCIVYLPLDEPEEFLLREHYTEEQVRNHIELKCRLFAVEQRAIERLKKERLLHETKELRSTSEAERGGEAQR